MSALHQPIWTLPIEAVYQSLASSEAGLSDLEANRRLAKFGLNELPTPTHRSLWLRFIDQLTHFMALLLWVAGILAFVSRTPALGWAIWAVIWINALFSFWQEFQAERALAALKNVLPMRVKVYRDGTLQSILARELVRGDVMQLEEGDRIPADARLVWAESFYVDVSVLTGESLPVARNAEPVPMREAISLRSGQPLPRQGEYPLQEKINPAEIANLVLAGATVATGRAVAVVYGTGAQTEFGQVAHLTTIIRREPSTLEVQVARIVRIITAIALGMGITVFLLSHLLIGMDVSESFIFAIGIIVANVPEGLLPTVTLALALGIQRMAKQNALVKRLSAVETLSATSVICTDKTGTLTKNEMTVRYLWLPSSSPTLRGAATGGENGDRLEPQLIEVTGAGYDPTDGTLEMPADPAAGWKVRLLLIGAALCSNARLMHPSPNRWQEIGDPTEAALLVVAAKAGLNLESLQNRFPRLREVPFDSRRRLMTVVLDWRSSDIWPSTVPQLAMTKGELLEVLRHCRHILRNGTIEEASTPFSDQCLFRLRRGEESLPFRAVRMSKGFGYWVLPLLLALICILSIVGCSSVAGAADKLFSWQGERGYHLDCIRLPQANPPKYKFIFTAPDRRVLGIYHSTDPNPYLQLHLVGADQHPWGELDVGGQKPGDLFLKGTVGKPLQLIKILSSQEEIVLDQGELTSSAPA